MVIASLVSCGEGGTEDPADKYVGTWKSVCYSPYPNNTSVIYYTRDTRTFTKTGPSDLAASRIFEQDFTDGTCTQKIIDQRFPTEYSKFVIGSKATFLGQPVDAVTVTRSTGEVLTGYVTADKKQMLLASQTATSWSSYSPYTKQ
jgi:hypothetical protein